MPPPPLTLEQLVRFTVESVEHRDGGDYFTGTLSAPVKLVPDCSMLGLCALPPRVDPTTALIEVEVVRCVGVSLVVKLRFSANDWQPGRGEVLAAFDAYHFTAVRLALDPAIRWQRTCFTPSPAFVTVDGEWRTASKARPGDELRTDGTLVPDFWDHEHCRCCNACIEAPPGNPDAYVDADDRYWLCPDCFHRLIEPRDLSFADLKPEH